MKNTLVGIEFLTICIIINEVTFFKIISYGDFNMIFILFRIIILLIILLKIYLF